ncbi:hypothetical protein [Mycolicibacterium frederiksbergense]|uniref:hypothetical protein n=1 Tax=Mycolicibacterium frederiksbergense TaxID=117567 RepID=UPI0021F2F450|nr:hypothetical protein [Mycolicibacterium frederiksbergense]
MTCRVLKLARQPYYRWRANPITDAEVIEAYRANALFDAHNDDPEFGYRYLVEEAREAGESMAERTAWARSGVRTARSARRYMMILSSATSPPAAQISCGSAISLSTAPLGFQ